VEAQSIPNSPVWALVQIIRCSAEELDSHNDAHGALLQERTRLDSRWDLYDV
jgi:hypothetical protein